jgi:hypothetical protein
MKKPTLIGLGALGAALLATPPLLAQSATQERIKQTEQAVSEFVFVRQQIAQTKNEWRVYEEVTKRRIEFFENEIAQLRSEITAANEQISSAQATIDAKRQDIGLKRAANNVVLDAAPAIEARVRSLAEYLPRPLQTKLRTLLGQLGTPRQAAQRMAIVIGILNEVDKFNSEWVLDGDQIGNVAVDVLYMGLATAFYADENGTVGGVKRPAKGQWTNEERNDLAPDIARLIEFYQGKRKPTVFTPVPLQVTEIAR